MMNVKVPILISLGGGSRGGSVKEQRRLRCAPSCQGQREQAEDGGCLNAFQLHILLKYVKAAPPLKVDTDKCVGCKSCMKIGCPAISMKNGKARVDETLCVGCGVCRQLCRVGAFSGEEKEG